MYSLHAGVRFLLLVGAVLSAGVSLAGSGHRLGEPAAVELSFQPGARGPKSFLDDVESAIIARSRGEGCIEIRSRSEEGPDAPALVLSVELSEPRQEVVYDRPLAEAVRPGREPEQAADWGARFEIRVRWALRVFPSGEEVRSGRFSLEEQRQAQVIGPDPESEVREVVVDGVASRTLRDVCRGSTESLRKSVAAARAGAREPR